jgi:ribosome-associated translation inhibitor RaiA
MRTPTSATVVEPEVLVRGDVPPERVEEAVAMLRATCAKPPRPVLFARLTLTMAPDPAVGRPATAAASIDLSGRIIRAHADGETMGEAVDLLADRIRRGMRRLHGDHP